MNGKVTKSEGKGQDNSKGTQQIPHVVPGRDATKVKNFTF